MSLYVEICDIMIKKGKGDKTYMSVKGNNKWKIRLIKLHRKSPMLDTFIMFIFGLIAYPFNDHLGSCLFVEKKYTNQDILYCILVVIIDIFILVYIFKLSKEALNISVGNKKYTMKDFDDEFIRCMTEELHEKNTNERIEMYNKVHSLQLGSDVKSINAKRNVDKKWVKTSLPDKLDKGEN